MGISLLFQSGAADAIHRVEIPAPGSDMIENRTQLIPKIIHQTYINESIPERWQAGQQSCIDLHGDYEYILWTDAKSRDFIATEYPWALANFDSYNDAMGSVPQHPFFLHVIESLAIAGVVGV